MGFYIEDKRIGDDSPTYIIAEIGINHNGDEETAYKLIDAAVDAKADAVKFQKRHLPSLYLQDVLDHPEHYEQNFQYMIPILKEVELAEESFRKIKDYCEEKGITFICTPFDLQSADLLMELNVPAFKVSSADLTNRELIDFLAKSNLPMILSTGMSTWDEIARTAVRMKKHKVPFALLHCRSVYPVWPREVNLRMITQLKEFGVPVGYSGHELGITISLVAASMGACIIEKHITLDRKQKGPDHKVSLEPFELKRLVRDIRIADLAIGKQKRLMLRGEVLNRELFGKSIFAKQDIPKGETIREDLIEIKGPGKGLAPDRLKQLIGKKISRPIKAGDCFFDEDLGADQPFDFNNCFKSDWGLIARFTDYKDMLQYSPRLIEFHLAENDFKIGFDTSQQLDCQVVVHAPEYIGDKLLDLCSANEEIRSLSVNRAAETVELIHQLSGCFEGTPKMIVHPGAMSMKNKLDKKKLEDALARSLDELRQQNDFTDIELLFENLPPYPWYFGGQWKGNYFMDADEIYHFCRTHGMKICFDLSHMQLYCNAKEVSLKKSIETLLPVTSHLHLADGYGLDGEGVQFGEGDIDLEEILPLFNNFKGTWVPEIWRGHLNNGRGFYNALNYLKKYEL